MIVGAAPFLAVWVLAASALSRLAWFRQRPSLADRLAPYVDGGDPTQEIEDWLRER